MSEDLYREAEFVERCFCERPGPTRCACCHQPRCAEHLREELCTRCTQAVSRAMRRGTATAWWIGGASGVVVALATLPLLSAGAVFAGLAVALAGSLGTRKWTRAHAVRTLGRKIPLRGELPAEARDTAPERGSDTGMPPGGYR